MSVPRWLHGRTLLWGPGGGRAMGARELGRAAMLPFPALGQGTRVKGQGQCEVTGPRSVMEHTGPGPVILGAASPLPEGREVSHHPRGPDVSGVQAASWVWGGWVEFSGVTP